MGIFGIIFISISFRPFEPMSLLFGVLVEVYLGYRVFFSGDKIQFDEDNMYIIYREGETEVVLRNVFYVARTSFSIGGLGKIKYYYQGEQYYTQFYPKYFSRTYRRFTQAVTNNNNPNAIIL